MRKSLAIALVGLMFAACKPRLGESPAKSQDAIKALGSTVPATQFDHNFWQREHDANSPAWNEAKRLCGQTVLANYPNCLPVNDIVQLDQRKRAEAGNRAAGKIEEMSRRGYLYDYARKAWLPALAMQSAGCASAPAYPNDPKRIGFSTWKCPTDAVIPKGIPDEAFSREEENATN
jgi:hypothetical protein